MTTKKQQKDAAKAKARNKAISQQQIARLNAEAAEKCIAELTAKELKKMTFAAEQEEAKRRAAVQFAEIRASSKGKSK